MNPLFSDVARIEGFYTPELMREIAEEGSVRDVQGVPERVKSVFVTAHDITPECHVRMQAAFQKHTDNAVSKTVNFPTSATPNDVQKVYMLAHELGCKGVTIYRDASRKEQVLNRGSGKGAGGGDVEAHAPVDAEVQDPDVTETQSPNADETQDPQEAGVRSTPRPRPPANTGLYQKNEHRVRQSLRDGKPGRARAV